MKIGVLGMQGDIEEHLAMLGKMGIGTFRVKSVKTLDMANGLIIPGGESTTMLRLLKLTGLFGELKKKIQKGFPVYGTCAGMILLSKKIISHSDQDSLNVLDISVARNGYGRQVESFEAELSIDSIGEKPFKAIFIRAPLIVRVGKGVETLVTYEGVPVMVRSGNILASSFHPELSNDSRIHELFLRMVKNASRG